MPVCLQGLIFTAGSIYKILHALNFPIHVQEVRWRANPETYKTYMLMFNKSLT